MLRIEVQQDRDAVTIKLEGRVAGLAVKQLNRAWIDFAPSLGSALLSIDLRKVTRADAYGVKALRAIQALTGAKLITCFPLTRYVAEDVARHCALNAARKARKTAVARGRFHSRNGTA